MPTKPLERIKGALAENTAQLKVLADRYVSIIARAQSEIEKEEAEETPSVWKIEAFKHLRQRAEENLARFKAGPERLPQWMKPTTPEDT